jgi:hypothetical protein
VSHVTLQETSRLTTDRMTREAEINTCRIPEHVGWAEAHCAQETGRSCRTRGWEPSLEMAFGLCPPPRRVRQAARPQRRRRDHSEVWVSVDLPRDAGQLPALRGAPSPDRIVRRPAFRHTTSTSRATRSALAARAATQAHASRRTCKRLQCGSDSASSSTHARGGCCLAGLYRRTFCRPVGRDDDAGGRRLRADELQSCRCPFGEEMTPPSEDQWMDHQQIFVDQIARYERSDEGTAAHDAEVASRLGPERGDSVSGVAAKERRVRPRQRFLERGGGDVLGSV